MTNFLGPRHRELHAQYVEELRAAKVDVNRWWEELVSRTLELTASEIEAAEHLRKRWPVGPAAHPRFLAVIRNYYLACEDLNKLVGSKIWNSDSRGHRFVSNLDAESEDDADDDLPISPVLFVAESLFTEETDDLARIVGNLTYWPIGVNWSGQRE